MRYVLSIAVTVLLWVTYIGPTLTEWWNRASLVSEGLTP